ncbi:MAG: hypothetical protein SH818_07840 [Saprospiraceae bacterium]|nr:hypothetical protein [Saprospiraceae bacterium]
MISGLLLGIGCIHSEFSEQDIIVQYHLEKIKRLSRIDIPDVFRLKSFAQSEEGAYYKIQFQLDFPKEDIREMSEQFRVIRRLSTGPGWGKFPLGWEYFHQPLLDEQFKLRIDTLAQQLEYSYIMAY